MKRKIHKTKRLKAGESFAIVCNTPATDRTLHAFSNRDVTCKRCQALAAVADLARGARVH